MIVKYVLHGRFPTERAHGIQIAKLCEALGRRVQLELIVPVVMEKVDPFTFYSIERSFSIHYVTVPNIPLRSSKIGFLIEKAFFLLASKYYIQKTGADFVITREPFLSILIETPCVLEIHDLPKSLFMFANIFNHAKTIIAKTKYIKTALIQAGVKENKIRIIRNAVDLSMYNNLPSKFDARDILNLSKNKKIIMYTGSLQKWKGVETLVEAATFLPNTSFVIVGGKESEIKKISVNAPTNISWVEQRNHSDIPLFLVASDILVLPNLPGEDVSEKYTSPLKLFEYMAMDRPIVASRLPSILDVLSEDEAYFFIPGNSRDLSRILKEVIDTNSNEYRISNKKTLQHTWDTYAEQLLQDM